MNQALTFFAIIDFLSFNFHFLYAKTRANAIFFLSILEHKYGNFHSHKNVCMNSVSIYPMKQRMTPLCTKLMLYYQLTTKKQLHIRRFIVVLQLQFMCFYVFSLNFILFYTIITYAKYYPKYKYKDRHREERKQNTKV